LLAKKKFIEKKSISAKDYFLVVVSFLVVSAIILEESVFMAAESVAILAESVLIAEESALASVLALLLQAANAAIAATKKNFFMKLFFNVN
jgi:uncharacterized membrane protein YiaA